MKNFEYYDQKKDSYRLSGGRERILRKLIPDNAKKVLDVGCGSGGLAKILQAKGKTVFGADISSTALDQAKLHLNGSFCFDVQKDDWPEELMEKKFDLVIASEVIEHIFQPSDFLEKAKSLISKEGSLIITTPNLLFWKNRLKMLFGKFRYQEKGLLDFGHIRFFTIKTTRDMFSKAGFKIEQEEHFCPNLYKRKLNFIGKIFPGFFAYQFGFRLVLQK